MKVGIEIKIDVKKILKERLYQGSKGTYLTLTSFIDSDNPDQYSNHGFVAQSVSKEEREQGIKTPILGNIKIFWGPAESQNQNQGYQNQPQNSNQGQNTQGYQPQNQNGYNQPNQNQSGQQPPFNQSQDDTQIPF